MEDKELSKWFDINEQKPWETGVYEVDEDSYGKWFSYWDGKKFGYLTMDVNESIKEFSLDTSFVVEKWRGLASDPSAKPKPKARGNRKVTRYVVMQKANYASDYPLASFDDCNFADAYIASNKKSARLPMYIQKIRFRTPEA